MKRHFVLAIAMSVTLLAVAHDQAAAGEVTVLSAVGVRQIMQELGPRFERASGHRLVSTFDSTGLIVKRITAGEDVDIVIINRAGIDSLAKAGKVSAVSATDVASSVTAIAVRKGTLKPDISSADAFKRTLLSAKSIARVSPTVGGSSGDHITMILARLGIADEVNAKSVVSGRPGANTGSPGYLVASGQAEIALHQLQELMAVPGIEIVGPFPGDLQGTFVFSAAITANARERDASRALIDFLRTSDAAAAIRAKGMEPAIR